MIKNFIKIAWRNLWKNKTFTFLNVLGLSIAFGVAILLSMTAFFDLSYDQFHKNKNELFQLYSTDQTPKGAEAATSNPIPLAPAMQEEVPGIDKITRMLTEDALVTYKDNELNLGAAYVDDDFFSMFSFPIEAGDHKNPVGEKTAAVITKKTAKTLFGNENALGKTITILINGREEPFTITSVMEDFPPQSSMNFDIALNFISFPSYAENIDRWDSRNHQVYVQLQQGITAAQFENNSRAFTALHYKDEMESAKRDGAQPNKSGIYKQFHLLPIADAHFAKFQNGVAQINKVYPYLILGLALLILFIASVNFINMSIARSAQRLREIGMRKTLGAARKQLFLQFWLESVFVFIAAVGIGVLISLLLLDPFKTLFRTDASLSNVTTPLVLVGFVISFVIITLIAGGYPALLLTRLGTLQALKGKMEAAKSNQVRNSLMVLQFSIAILLITGTLVLHSQLNYMRNKDLGFNKEQVIAFPLNGKKADRTAVQLLRNELQDKPGILDITAADNILGRGKDGSAYTSVLGFDYKGHGIKTNMLVVDYDYVETLDLDLVAGRSFSRQYATDSLSLVINETMANQLDTEDPLSARIILDDSISYSVIGVMKDYNFQDLNKKIEPITLFMNPDWGLYYAYVKVAPQNIAQSFDKVKTAWGKVEPNAEFLGSFLDENIDRTFKREKIMTTIITSGSIIAIALSCIGLFAISLLVVTQRTKEIGVRKVVGASIASITFLLTKDFLKLVGLAFLIASPIAWWLLNQWLQEYPYRIELNLWYFLVAGGLAVCIAVATISIKTIKAALANPVKSLRTE